MLFCAVASVTAFPAAAQTLSAGTYNVRQLNAGDDARGDGWERRLPVIASLIRFHDFDIFGAQEVFHSQLEDLLGALPGYGYTGVGRDDGAEAGEYSVVFYKRERFELLDSGHFWLAEDPSRPNRGWDAKYVRICCWGRFLDRQTKERFWFFTLHTDHKGERAQSESCRLALDKIRTMCRGERAVLTGDFNVGETSESYAVLHDFGAVVRHVRPGGDQIRLDRHGERLRPRPQDLPPHRLRLRDVRLPGAALRHPHGYLSLGGTRGQRETVPRPHAVRPLPGEGRAGLYQVKFTVT